MAFANNEGASVNGVSQEYLINYIIYLQGVLNGIVTKLDADAGTGLDTDYEAALQSQLPVAAGPTGGSSDIETISAAVVA